ncbi:MAG: hypothetical protein VB068_13730 [Petrimonas sp.]|nr:hypothetical protein [Petrimonas sp.]
MLAGNLNEVTTIAAVGISRSMIEYGICKHTNSQSLENLMVSTGMNNKQRMINRTMMNGMDIEFKYEYFLSIKREEVEWL